MQKNTPMFVIAYSIVHSGLSGGINFTTSYNPYKYNGLKYSLAWGGHALPETTKKIEKYCTSI